MYVREVMPSSAVMTMGTASTLPGTSPTMTATGQKLLVLLALDHSGSEAHSQTPSAPAAAVLGSQDDADSEASLQLACPVLPGRLSADMSYSLQQMH